MTPKSVQKRLKAGPSARDIDKPSLTFLTAYPAAGGSYGGEIEAHDIDQARAIALQRRIGERVISAGGTSNSLIGVVETLLKENLTQKDILNALHEAVYMCWIGLEAGTITPREVMSDGGLIHRLVHLAAGVREFRSKREAAEHCAKLAREIADRVPGWPFTPKPHKTISKRMLAQRPKKKRK